MSHDEKYSIPDRMYEAQNSTAPAALTREQMRELFAIALAQISAAAKEVPTQRHRDPEPGEIWLKKPRSAHGTGRFVRITGTTQTYSNLVRWEAVDGSRGQRAGTRALHYWHEDCVFVADTYEDWIAAGTTKTETEKDHA